MFINSLFLYSITHNIFASLSSMTSFQLLSLFLLVSSSWCQDGAPVPVVLWHGMGDSAAGMIGIAVGLYFAKKCTISIF